MTSEQHCNDPDCAICCLRQMGCIDDEGGLHREQFLRVVKAFQGFLLISTSKALDMIQAAAIFNPGEMIDLVRYGGMALNLLANVNELADTLERDIAEGGRDFKTTTDINTDALLKNFGEELKRARHEGKKE